ncbi:hypothetical protein VST63_25245 [Mycolicibacterium sp. 050232]|uniref:hypothetical protein n=1 Tax=Mycolicibacterium sp. 050232 TaxID=3113982 RepID=UPI002E27B7D7|nr:hypothetical protein [Mycolicibacterium sp. 050232]MED5815680.1 hypothetical protein [Mycolicibacterium sp. 050232]
MKGPGAWPETDETQFHAHQGVLRGVLGVLSAAREKWSGHETSISAPNVWLGKAASAGHDKVASHTTEMNRVEQRIRDVIKWCGEAAGHISDAKEEINKNVKSGLDEIASAVREANDPENNISSKALNDKIDEIIGRKKGENADSLTRRAGNLGSKNVDDDADGQTTGDEKKEPSVVFAANQHIKGSGAVENSVRSALWGSDKGGGMEAQASGTDPVPAVSEAVANPKEAMEAQASGTDPVPAVSEAVVNPKEAMEAQAPATNPVPAVVPPGPRPDGPGGRTPQPPGLPAASGSAASTASGGGGGISGGASGAGGGAPSSPLSSIGSPGASGAEQAAGPAQAAGQAPVGGVPTDPLQAFSKGFADSAGTPVHAASSGGAPPPLAPSPAVPASDATTPASTQAPLSQTGAPAPAAPVQTPASGGSMGGGMGMGGMPLGPPPTAPPAAPVAPPAAPPPTVAPPANIAGGAQVAPIPVSAARAERDAAQNAAKRTGSGPMELARRIAAALNAPDMANVEDFNFFWITAVTVDGRILVANNYGMSYIPEQVNLPDQIVMVSADESIPPVERASWATYPIVAVQHWAQQNDTTLRAVIALEHQFTNADSGVHQEVLAPEDIPAKGKMAGRDRLQVIAPQISGRLAQIGDGDLVKILPPAPVDTSPPEDRRTELWDKVWQPLFSGASNRGQVHLQAFLEYAAHAQEWAVHGAHGAGDGPQQRRAVCDFIYWQHIGQMIADAIAE